MNEELASALLQEYKDTMDDMRKDIEFLLNDIMLLENFQDFERQLELQEKYK